MNQDTRYVQTEEKIRSTFLRMLGTVGFQKITIRRLIEDAGINRSTFYLHYEDKYALLHALEQELLDEVDDFLTGMFRKFSENGEEIRPSLITSAATFLQEHKDLFLLYAGPKGDPEFMQQYGSAMWNNLTAFGIIPPLDETHAAYLRSAFTGAISGMFSHWMQTGFRETPEEYFLMVRDLLRITEKISASLD